MKSLLLLLAVSSSTATEVVGIRDTRFERFTFPPNDDACRPSDDKCRRAAARAPVALEDLVAARLDIVWVAAEWIPRDLGTNRGAPEHYHYRNDPDPRGDYRFINFMFHLGRAVRPLDNVYVFWSDKPQCRAATEEELLGRLGQWPPFTCGDSSWPTDGFIFSFDASSRLPFEGNDLLAFAFTSDGDLRVEFRYPHGWSEIVYRAVKLEDFAEKWEEECDAAAAKKREEERDAAAEGHGSVAYFMDKFLTCLEYFKKHNFILS